MIFEQGFMVGVEQGRGYAAWAERGRKAGPNGLWQAREDFAISMSDLEEPLRVLSREVK